MSSITTHVLDVALGRPARAVPVTLEFRPVDDASPNGGQWRLVGSGLTDVDGRQRTLVPADTQLAAGTYRLTFDTDAYFAASSIQGFYPAVTVVFSVLDVSAHYHVPLLLSPFGYTTYRGS
ncbi:MAG: hydroxyisourate hydrolase [Acidobacteriota bacterium]